MYSEGSQSSEEGKRCCPAPYGGSYFVELLGQYTDPGFKYSALSIPIMAEIIIVHAAFNNSFKDGLSCGIYVNLFGDLLLAD